MGERTRSLRVRFWIGVMSLLCTAGAWRSLGLRWRLYLWAVDKAGAATWGGEVLPETAEDEVPW